MAAKTFAEIAKFNPYHDARGRFAAANAAASFTYAPGKSKAHDAAIQREKETGKEKTGKGFKGTLYHGSPNTDIEEFDINRAGTNTSTGEKLIFFTDSKQMADDFSYERLEGSSMFTNRRGKKGRVYEVDVEMKNPLDFRNLSDQDIDNILQLDVDGILTKDMVKMYAQKNHQLLKSGLEITAESLKSLGYDGLIANAGKAGHGSLEYAVVDSKQAKIKKAAPTVAKTFDDILKFNPYHGRYKKEIENNGPEVKKMEKTEETVTIYKTDDDKRLVFGWASVSIKVDGEQLEDHQKDLIDPEDLEEAAYEYVLNFRDTGEEHNQGLRKKGKLVESCVFTAEKQKAMGIPEGILPIGWWIGFKIEDDAAWEKVKNGTYRMFSIEGRANRVPVEKAAPEDTVEKFNPNHDSKGRFATANSSGQASGIGSLKPIKPNPKWAYQPDDETDLDDMVENPIPFVGVGKDMELAIKFDDETIQSGYVSNATVNISELQTLQPFVLRSGIENYQRWDETDKPYVVEFESKYYVLDGNHRIAQAMLNGEKTVTVDLSKRKLRVSKSISDPDRFIYVEEFP